MKQLSAASRVWATDTANDPISTSTSGIAGLTESQNAWVNFMGITNLLASSKFLHCPADTESQDTPAFNVRISYFLNLDARKTNPRMVLFGDDNLLIGQKIFGLPRPIDSMGVPGDADIPLKSGVWDISTNVPVSWTIIRHGYYVGIVAFGDGSVAKLTISGMDDALQQTGLATNRLAIP